jgi:hypothetical protein
MTPRVKWKRGHDMSTNKITNWTIDKLVIEWELKCLESNENKIAMTYLLYNYELRQSYNLSISLRSTQILTFQVMLILKNRFYIFLHSIFSTIATISLNIGINNDRE